LVNTVKVFFDAVPPSPLVETRNSKSAAKVANYFETAKEKGTFYRNLRNYSCQIKLPKDEIMSITPISFPLFCATEYLNTHSY
jgi:hypothetical protein